jgi:hypothetical protein
MNKVNEYNFNETMKGYMVRAIKHAKFTNTQEKKLWQGLRWAIDEMTMEDARKEYNKNI